MMTRTELTKRLAALGYAPIGQSSGKGYTAWYGPRGKLLVPDADIIRDDTAADIIRRAAGL